MFIHAMLARDGAIRQAARVLRKQFTQSRAISVGYICTQLRQFSTAITAFETAIEEESDEEFALKCLGDCYKALGGYPQAIAVYERAIQAGFNNASVYADLGTTLIENGDYSAAIELLKTALEKNSEYEHLWAQLGDCYMNRKQYNEGVRSYQRANKAITSDSTHYSGGQVLVVKKGLGKAYLASGNVDAANKLGYKRCSYTLVGNHKRHMSHRLVAL